MKKLALAIAAALALSATAAQARDNIEIVGSSTVYPFSTTVAEQFAKKTGSSAPKVEATGTGGGFKLFCSGAGIDTPDITNASRRMKQSELDDCIKNGVDKVTEVQVGFDGIAIANAKSAADYDLSMKDMFMALAKNVPNDKGELVANPYKTWKEVNAALPDAKIEVLGPPPTSGTRDAFSEMVMEGGCKGIAPLDAIKDESKKLKEAGKEDEAKAKEKDHKAACTTIREDGAYIEAGENDNLIVQKLEANPNALGIFGYSFLEQNEDKVKGSKVDGVAPTFESISDGSYPVSRPLFMYVKNSHAEQVKNIKEFVTEFTSEAAWGDDGYLADKGLIPMPEDLRKTVASAAAELKPLAADELK
ncbi:substrate-binding domain-containing protein [Thiothrix lacustris]|uniref:Substrate-binding domain-containing protein n=1 Tax=Thiothrix lacustris TaxID=525917 RepID=A0ABY9MPB9_9GAMM|nr:substrate-binding domain-containing protein [Thiothrix lacustris]WML90373.1 substrate-binding domain-containing protein [Thiothrix lacustris]